MAEVAIFFLNTWAFLTEPQLHANCAPPMHALQVTQNRPQAASAHHVARSGAVPKPGVQLLWRQRGALEVHQTRAMPVVVRANLNGLQTGQQRQLENTHVAKEQRRR